MSEATNREQTRNGSAGTDLPDPEVLAKPTRRSCRCRQTSYQMHSNFRSATVSQCLTHSAPVTDRHVKAGQLHLRVDQRYLRFAISSLPELLNASHATSTISSLTRYAARPDFVQSRAYG